LIRVFRQLKNISVRPDELVSFQVLLGEARDDFARFVLKRVPAGDENLARPVPEGSPEWEVLYQKTRDEVFRRRFRLA
jgi:hypothetical protein